MIMSLQCSGIEIHTQILISIPTKKLNITSICCGMSSIYAVAAGQNGGVLAVNRDVQDVSFVTRVVGCSMHGGWRLTCSE